MTVKQKWGKSGQKDQKPLTRTDWRGSVLWERFGKKLQGKESAFTVGLHFRWSITLIDFRLITTETLKPLCKVTICCWRWGVQMSASLLNYKLSITEATMSIKWHQSGNSTQSSKDISRFYDFKWQYYRQNPSFQKKGTSSQNIPK